MDRLTLLQRCRKHAAEEDIPLRQLFHDVCRSSDTGTAVSFATVESPVYKRHRTATPTLPTDPRSCDATLFGSRFATTGQSPFHRGQVTLGDDDTAVVFASDDQLELLRTASVDSTFCVVLVLFHQLFTIFAPLTEHTFPVCSALTSRKTTALYKAVFRPVHELVLQFRHK